MAERVRRRAMFFAALMGSIDDLALFVPMLAGHACAIRELMLGVSCATFVIITFCICLGLCKPVANCIAKIPFFIIVIIFATGLLLQGLVFDGDLLAGGTMIFFKNITNITDEINASTAA